MLENVNGISVITCSVNQEQCEQMHNSIKNTIGLCFEFISFDNREKHWGICKVYNHSAQEAKYPYLCFMHEDVIMGGNDWGRIIVEFIENTPNCGVIGFAGGLDAPKNFLRWWDGEKRMNVHDTYIGGGGSDIISKYRAHHFSNPSNESFSQVLCIDGLCLIVSKAIWEETKFDELNFNDFHFYDNDFSFAVSRNHKNYVYLQADVFHYSGGKTEKIYYKNARIFQKKWKETLPDAVGNRKITKEQEMNNAEHFFRQRQRFDWSLINCVFHFIEVNGFLLLVYMIYKKVIKIIYKLVIPKNSDSIIKHKL